MMPTCNIDQSGRVLRFFIGVILFFGGSLIFMLALPGGGLWWRLFQAAVMLLGIFMMFEGAMGWCALRALGVKTRL